MNPASVSLTTTILIIFMSALGGAVLARKVKQPTIVGYIGAGLLVGNLFPSLIDRHIVGAVSDIGVTLLLFTLGVEFSFHRMKKVINAVGLLAVIQILLTIFALLVILLAFRVPFIGALFIACAGSLSSTAVVIKLLSEQGELETAPGELSAGWLIIQDLAIVPIMVILPAIVRLTGDPSMTVVSSLTIIASSILKAALVLAFLWYIGKTGVTRILNRAGTFANREIFLLTTIGLVFLASSVSFVLGLSPAIGAFLAGLLVAETSQNHAIFSEIRPLRDIFTVIFFVSLGMALPVSMVINVWKLVVGVSILVMVIKFILTYGLIRFVGIHRKTAFLVSISLIQMSEFSFIIAKEGSFMGALQSQFNALLITVTFVTIVVSAPLIAKGQSLYCFTRKKLGKAWPLLLREKEEMTPIKDELPYADHIVLLGYGRVGKYIGRAFEMSGIPYVVVDYNHMIVSTLRRRGITVVYGDPADRDVLDRAQVDRAKAVIIAIPDRHTQEMVIGHVQSLSRRVRIICRSHHEEDQGRLKSLGVHTLIQPEFEAAISIIGRVLTDYGVTGEELAGKVSRLKIEHGMG